MVNVINVITACHPHPRTPPHTRTFSHSSPPGHPQPNQPETDPIKSCHSLLLLLPFCQCLFSLILLCSASSFHSISICFSCAQTLLRISFHVLLLPLFFSSSPLPISITDYKRGKTYLKTKKKKYIGYYVYMYIVGINLQHFHGFPCAICH